MALSGIDKAVWLQRVKEALIALGVPVDPKYPIMRKRFHKWSRLGSYVYYDLYGGECTFLAQQRKRWYPEGVKEVPRDVQLTPIILANWFMGDGSSSRFKEHPNLVQAVFATESFSKESVFFLRRLLSGISIETTCSLDHSGQKICVNRKSSVKLLMDKIDQHVLLPYRYKIKMPGWGKGL